MEHPGSRGIYDYIANWIAPDFFYSKNDIWHRMGMLGVFGDFVLSCTPGDIFEIGVGESSIYLSSLARKYNRTIYHCDIAAGKIDNPLTIPGYLAPERAIFYRGPSDQLFKDLKLTPIAFAFIDGDHNYDQVKKDFFNLLPNMVDNSYIALHDTYPPDESYIDENRCGTVYKLRLELQHNPRFDCLTLPRGCAMGVGLTIIRKRPDFPPPFFKGDGGLDKGF